MSVKKQLICYLFLFALLALLPFLLIRHLSKDAQFGAMKKESEILASTTQNWLALSIAENQSVADKLVFFLENYKGELTKPLVEENLKKVLDSQESNEVHTGAVIFIPDKTPLGKYSPCYYKNKNQLFFLDLASEQHDYSTQNWYKKLLNTEGTPVWSFITEKDLRFDTEKELMITYSVPLKRDGKLIAFVIINVLSDRLKERLFTQTVSKDERYSFILTPDGDVIGFPAEAVSGSIDFMTDCYPFETSAILEKAFEDWNSIFEENQNQAPKDRKKFYGPDGLRNLFFKEKNIPRAFIGEDMFIGKTAFYSITPLPKPNSLLVTVTSETRLLSMLPKQENTALMAFLITIAFALFLIFYISGKAAKPIEKLVAQTKEFSKGNFDYRIDLKNKKTGKLEVPSKEIKELIDAFNTMGEKLQESFGELENTRQEILMKLLRASEYKDMNTAEHLRRINGYCSVIARKLGLTESQIKMLADASMMHDVGKIGIPDNVLLKPGKLTEEEFEIMKTHSKVGKDILSDSDSALLQMAERIASSHHEKWNGKGYPQGLSGEDIPLESRITTICDIFDALISTRPYKEPWSFEEAMNFIEKEGGVTLDPKIVEIFVNSKDEIREIAKS